MDIAIENDMISGASDLYAKVASLRPVFFFLYYREVIGIPPYERTRLAERSFFSSEEALDHAQENSLEGFVVKVNRRKRIEGIECWDFVDYTSKDVVLTRDEKEKLRQLVYRPGDDLISS